MAYVSNTDRRLSIVSFLINLSKFALDSAINVSLKGFTGGKKLYQTFLQEKLKSESNRLKLEDAKCQSTKMEDINEFKHQTTADKGVGGSEPMMMKKKNTIPQGLREMELQDSKRKTIFIRSRL